MMTAPEELEDVGCWECRLSEDTSGTSSANTAPGSASAASHLMICEGPAPNSAAFPAATYEQIQLLLREASVQTTERYLGTRQNLVPPSSVAAPGVGGIGSLKS